MMLLYKRQWKLNFTVTPNAEGGHQGFEYNEELYLYTEDYWEIVHSSDLTFSRRFTTPYSGANAKIIEYGHVAFVISANIWQFDLSKQ